jgi:hypothetical protein
LAPRGAAAKAEGPIIGVISRTWMTKRGGKILSLKKTLMALWDFRSVKSHNNGKKLTNSVYGGKDNRIFITFNDLHHPIIYPTTKGGLYEIESFSF